jgi:hypothetical protein
VKTSKRKIPVAAVIGIVFAFLVGGSVTRAQSSAAQPHPALGINLSGPADWNAELPFVDTFRLSRAWISQKRGEAWGKGPKLELDEHGWVQRLEPGCFAETPLCTIDGGHYPSGKLLHAANAHPQMRFIYAEYYAPWEAAGGDLLCHFSSVGRWSKWGSWGLLQFADEDASQTPKFAATMEWAKKLGQRVGAP